MQIVLPKGLYLYYSPILRNFQKILQGVTLIKDFYIANYFFGKQNPPLIPKLGWENNNSLDSHRFLYTKRAVSGIWSISRNKDSSLPNRLSSKARSKTLLGGMKRRVVSFEREAAVVTQRFEFYKDSREKQIVKLQFIFKENFVKAYQKN